MRLQEILNEVKTAIQKVDPDYDVIINRLNLYYDMELITFGIGRDRNLIIQFPVFIQLYTQQPMILYQIETVPVPIVDQNKHADSYMHLQIDRSCIALNSETYILIKQQELIPGQRIGYEFYCEELFIGKDKSEYSCASAIYFDSGLDVTEENLRFAFYYNKTDITPTVLDGGNEIILAN